MYGVTHRRTLLLAIAIYVTLDFSLPMMPGAFQFALDDSVQGIHTIVGREAARIAVSADSLQVPASPHIAVAIEERAIPRRLPGRRPPVTLRWSPARHDPPPSSEDPH
jgi:hypothetical protein